MWWLWEKVFKGEGWAGRTRWNSSGVRGEGSAENEGTTATPPSASPGRGPRRGAGVGQEKSPQELRNLQRRGRSGDWPTPTWSAPPYSGDPSKQDVLTQSLHRENRPGERRGGNPLSYLSRTPGTSGYQTWRLNHPSPAPPGIAQLVYPRS